VYPVEPKNKKKVNRGSTANRTFYYAKDINYIAQEPIINKFREFKVYVKRLRCAKGKRDRKRMRDLRQSKPFYKIDHIVKERLAGVWIAPFFLVFWQSPLSNSLDRDFCFNR
jgi:pescadillo protein